VVSWCSADEVSARVNGNPPAELLQEFADRATSLLYTLSGRRFQGRKMVTIEAQVGPRDSRYAELVKGTPAQEDVLPPAHITSIARQGVTYSYADRAALAREDQTGVYEVDLFLRAVNPTGMRHQPKVVAP
jgi:hypothetical protein